MNTGFFGEYQHSLDDKGRLTIPSRFREALGQDFVITKGLDRCLFIFTAEEWEKFQEKLRGLPVSDKAARDFTRFFFSGAAECTLDRQGRVGIAPSQRKHASLDKEAMVIGVGSRLEIWDLAAWEEYNDMDPTDIADKLAELGI